MSGRCGTGHPCKSLLRPRATKQIVTKKAGAIEPRADLNRYHARMADQWRDEETPAWCFPPPDGAMTRRLSIGALIFLLVPLLAQERGWGAGFGPALQAQGPMKQAEPPNGGAREWSGRREGRPPDREQRPQGRMTDEERRDLHKDLDRANREIYRPRPSR
jgi:hypothetical protein